MAVDKERKKHRANQPAQKGSRGGPSRSTTASGPAAPPEQGISRRHAHVDDLIRVIRNLAVLALVSSAASALIAYAGICMGVSPEICWIGSVGSGPMLVRAFIKLFETIRPVLPDAPADPPSSDAP
ncbi:hypothetical protein [Streptomyces sp. NPDC059639]|uniref:hypothetical protein n=1 Tax=Streptomyces sp. NPDC059639 TaxID=3346891 RepID=UPI0036B6BEDC